MREPTIQWDRYRGVLFDLDGVITSSAALHERAWALLFDMFLAERADQLGIVDRSPFTALDYQRFVDGKPRYDGVRSFLESRGVTLPEGDPGDPPGWDSVSGLGNRKNEHFNQLLAAEGIDPYPGSLRLLDHLDGLGTPQAIVSSSNNARGVLAAAGLAGRFEVIVDGTTATAERLHGKPAPDMFTFAAARLGVEPADTVVVEDALSGVAAGRAGGFALVVGVDRGAGAEALQSHGADIVVADLAELLGDGPAGDGLVEAGPAGDGER